MWAYGEEISLVALKGSLPIGIHPVLTKFNFENYHGRLLKLDLFAYFFWDAIVFQVDVQKSNKRFFMIKRILKSLILL